MGNTKRTINMKNLMLSLLVFSAISCTNKHVAPPLQQDKENRIQKVILQFGTVVNFTGALMLWDADMSEIIFKDMSGTILEYDKKLNEYIEVPNLRTIRFTVDSLSSTYIRDSLKLLPSDLSFIDNSIQVDGTSVQWLVIYDNGELYEGCYNGTGATENHARLAHYLLNLTEKQHPDLIAKDYLFNLQRQIDMPE